MLARISAAADEAGASRDLAEEVAATRVACVFAREREDERGKRERVRRVRVSRSGSGSTSGLNPTHWELAHLSASYGY